MKEYLKIILGLFFLCLGILVGFFELIALLDPVGTKGSDDSDPFGNPYIPWQQHAVSIIFTLICFGFSYVLICNDGENSSRPK